MTSTNTFQGFDTGSKPSSRVLQPPGGGSNNIFGGYEEDVAPSRRPNKMASKVFAPAEEPQTVSRRSNPPGGKSSGIFGQPEAPVQSQRPVPPGGATSSIFGSAESAPVQSTCKSHPNKPKDNLAVGPESESPAIFLQSPQAKVVQPEVKEEAAPPSPVPAKEEPAAAAVSSPPQPEPPSAADEDSLKNHEPHLGPKPRSHNRVLNPPGGKSSVIFY